MRKRRIRKSEPVEESKPREIDPEAEAKCMIARHGTAMIQTTAFSTLVSMTDESLDLSLREEIARTAQGMVILRGTFEQWIVSRLRTGQLI